MDCQTGNTSTRRLQSEPRGVSGGSNKRTTVLDGQRFSSVMDAAKYLVETKGISLAAARKRLASKRVEVKTRAKPGESLVKTPAYKAWSHIKHGALNPKSKDYIPGIEMHDPWKTDFERFHEDVGDPPAKGMAFTRLDKSKGFFPDNCAWLTKSESSKLNAANMKANGTLVGRRGKNSIWPGEDLAKV